MILTGSASAQSSKKTNKNPHMRFGQEEFVFTVSAKGLDYDFNKNGKMDLNEFKIMKASLERRLKSRRLKFRKKYGVK